MKKLISTAVAMVLLTTVLSGCSMNRDERTLAGAGLGAAVGYGLSGGDAGATVGGALVGGVLGNQYRRW